MILYHATTPKKARRYKESGCILKPVRGFTTMQSAMLWAMSVGRSVVYEIVANKPYKLPDYHNQFGDAWWNDEDVTEFKCIISEGRYKK